MESIFICLSHWEKLNLSCVSMKLLKTSIARLLFCFCMFLSLFLCQSCTVTLAIWQHTLMLGSFFVFVLMSWLDNPAAIITCLDGKLITLFFLSGSPLSLIFVHIGFWWDAFSTSRACYASFCFFVFRKWWKVQEWQLEVLYAYKKDNMNNVSMHFPFPSGAPEYFRRVKRVYYCDLTLQRKCLRGKTTAFLYRWITYS